MAKRSTKRSISIEEAIEVIRKNGFVAAADAAETMVRRALTRKLTRCEFDALPASDKSERLREGWEVVDEDGPSWQIRWSSPAQQRQ